MLAIGIVVMALLAAIPAWAAAPSRPVVSGASLTWGYGFRRARVSDIPAAYTALSGVSQRAGPWVVAVPVGYRSQSTPVFVGNRIFFFAFRDAQHGALFESTFQADGTPSPAREIAIFQP